MAEHVIKLPDIGEGVAEAELVEWQIQVGDMVREDAVLAAVMTDKATVEIPSPVEGIVTWLGAEIGQTVAVGSPIVRLKVADDGNIAQDTGRYSERPMPSDPNAGESSPLPERKMLPPSRSAVRAPRVEGEKPLASPAVRLRAREAGIDLRQVAGSGPAGRITHDDLDAFVARGAGSPSAGPRLTRNDTVEDIKVVGLRRRIAEKMQLAKAHIPHITYVEEVDVTSLEDLRATLNRDRKPDRPKLTILPFLMRAMVKAIADQPRLNSTFDDEVGIIHQHGGVHIGIATQTPGGLMVPVARHCEARDIWDCATEVNRLAEAARQGTATREELTGSTITITSLGALGGIVTTPVINHPEVAIVGVNKMAVRPLWDGTTFQPRKVMNLSSGFDHRVIDGWDAATFVQRLKALLETPATIFVEG
jgi:2-oxoisovalerate dehydrogenase E2 component (dihydrolipoyl transacylase)